VKQSNERMSGVPEIDMSEILSDNGVELYQHQIDGIRWLAHKESGQSGVPPYYKLRKYGKFAEYYRCTLSNKVFKGRDPSTLTNSILADDMGLGKVSFCCVSLELLEHISYTYVTLLYTPV
jgi:SNF2 family DNA or RNA helicase